MAVPVLKYGIGNSASTTLSSAMSNSDTAAALTSDTNFSAKSGEGMVLLDENQATEELAYATGKSGSSLTIPLVNRGLEGGSAQAHAISATVKGILTVDMYNDIVDVLLEIFSQSTGKFVQLKDANGNEILTHTATGSAVNHVNITNAVASSPPVVGAVGDDTNIDLKLVGKGTGVVKHQASASIQVVAGATDTATGDGKFYFTIPPELNGMVITAVFAAVVTAGTTNTTDIQIHNVTDAVDVLSTKLTIDSGETTSATAATPAVINTSNDDVATNDVFRIDVDAVSTTAAKGLIVRLTFGF